MAIAYDSSAFNSWTTWTSHTLSHTCSGSDRILFWSALWIMASDKVTWVTYNGVSMTRIAHVWSWGERIYLYYLINPSTWVNNIVATTSSSATLYAQSTSYTGVKQSAQPDSSNTSAYATQTNMSTSTTTVADNSWLVWVFRASSTQTAVAGTTFRAGVNTTIQIGDSNGAKSPAGSYSLWTTFAYGWCAQIVASFSPTVTTPNTNPSFFLNFL
jgi:hypothetical protein